MRADCPKDDGRGERRIVKLKGSMDGPEKRIATRPKAKVKTRAKVPTRRNQATQVLTGSRFH